MNEVWRAPFRDLSDALRQLSKAHTAQDRLRAMRNVKRSALNIAGKREAVAHVVQLLESLPAKSRAAQQDLDALKRLQTKLDAMTKEKEASDKLIASLRTDLASERAAHAETKATYQKELAEANKHILAIKTQLVGMDKQIADAMTVLSKRNPKLFRQLTDPAKDALEQKLVKLERFMASMRTKINATAAMLDVKSISSASIIEAVLPSIPISMTRQRLLQAHAHISGKSFGAATAEAERFVAQIQKHVLIGDECVRYLASNPLFEMSRRAKYLRGVACTANSAEVLAHVHHFSMLTLAGAAATQMRVFHLAAMQAVLAPAPDLADKIADNLAAARELHALVRDTLVTLSTKHTHQFYFQHEVEAENKMLGFLKRQSDLFGAAQAAIIRFIAVQPGMADAANALATEFLNDDQIYVNSGISPDDLHHATQLSLQDLEPLNACVDIVAGYREMRTVTAPHLWVQPAQPDTDVVKRQSFASQLAHRMLDEVQRHRPQWAHCRAGVQLLMASVTLDQFAAKLEASVPLHLLDFRDTINYQAAELLASAESAEQIAGLLDTHAGNLGSLQVDAYVKEINASLPAPTQSLWRFSRKQLRDAALMFVSASSDHPDIHAVKHFRPDWLLVSGMRESELTGSRAYIQAITDHTTATQALAGTDVVDTIARTCIMFAPRIGPSQEQKDGVQLTHIAGRNLPMAQAAALTGALLQDRQLELPSVDMSAARRVVQHLAQLNPTSLVKVLQNTPSVHTLVDELGAPGAISGASVDEFLRRYPAVLRTAPEKSMVWFRSNECLAAGNCGDPGALMTNNLFECLSALQTLIPILEFVAHGSSNNAGMLDTTLTKQARSAVRFAGAAFVLDNTRQFHDIVQAPTGDSLRLQLIQAQKRNREQLVAQQQETVQLRQHIVRLYDLHASISKRMHEATAAADEQARKFLASRAALHTSARTMEASYHQLDNLKQQLANQGDRLVSHGLMATVMQQKYAAAVQMLELATGPDERRALQATVDSLKADVEAAQAKPTKEHSELLALRTYFEQQIATMREQATVLVNEMTVAEASASTAKSFVGTVHGAMTQCTQQLAATEKEILDRLNARMMLASQAAMASGEEERAHLLQQLRTIRDDGGDGAINNNKNVERVQRLNELQQTLADIVANSAAMRDELKQQLKTQAQTFAANEAALKQQLHESNARLSEVRNKLADMGTRSHMSGDAETQFKAGSDMLRQVGAALKQELELLKPLTDQLNINTDDLLARVHTVVNANISTPADLQGRSIDLSEALRMFVQLHAVKMQDVGAKLKDYDEQSRTRIAALEAEVKSLQQQIGEADVVAHKYNNIQQYLQQQVADETALAEEIEKQYLALTGEGRQALQTIAQLRNSGAEETKQRLSATVVAYQARYTAVLDTVVDAVHERLVRASQQYQATLPPDTKWSVDQLARSTKLPVDNTEGLFMLSLHAAWRRAQAHRAAAVVDLEAFVQFVLLTLDRVVAAEARTQTYQLEQLTAAAMAYKAGDIDALEREYDATVANIGKTQSAQTQWQEVEQLQRYADDLASTTNESEDKQTHEKRVRAAYVSVAARAAAAGGAVAQAYTLMTRVAELRHRDAQRQQLTMRIDEISKAKRAAEDELQKIRDLQKQREAEHRAAITQLQKDQQDAIEANRNVADRLQREMDASAASLRDSEAAHLYIKAKTSVAALQALREMHLSQTPDTLVQNHAEYMTKADVPQVLLLVERARSSVRDSLLLDKALVAESLEHMAQWAAQVRKQDQVIADFIGTTKDPEQDDYLSKLGALKKADPVPKLEVKPIKSIDPDEADSRLVHVLADRLDRVRADIQARDLSLSTMRQFIASMVQQQDELAGNNKKLGAELADLKSATDAKIAALTQAHAATQGKLDQALRQHGDIQVRLRAITHDFSAQTTDDNILLTRLEDEITTLRATSHAYQALVEQSTLLRQQLDALAKSPTAQSNDFAERRADVAKQLHDSETQLATTQQQTAASRDKLMSSFASQRAELAGRDAYALDKYRTHLAEWLKQEMQTIDTDIAQQERDEGLGPEARNRKRAEMFNNLAIQAEEKMVTFAATLQEQTDHDIQKLTMQHEDQVRMLEDESARQLADAELMVGTLRQVAQTLDIEGTLDAADANDQQTRIVQAVAALKYQATQDALAAQQYAAETEDLHARLSDAQQQLASTTQQLRDLQAASQKTEMTTVHRLYQELTQLRQQFHANEERVVLLEADNTRLANDLQRAEQQAQVLRTQLKEMNAQWKQANDELATSLREVTEERDELRRQLESLTANSEPPQQRSQEDILRMLSESIEFQQIVDTLHTLQDANARLEQQTQQFKDEHDRAQVCDAETANFLRTYFPTLSDGTDLLELSLSDQVNGRRNMCWLAKQLAFYENTGMFNSYWLSFNDQPRRVRLALWNGLRELFIQKHIINSSSSDQPCADFSTPLGCMQNSNRCFFDKTTCVDL